LTQKELFGFSRVEALYHKRIITRNVIIVKRYYWVFKSLSRSREPFFLRDTLFNLQFVLI
jgi:tRNA isopentenyl-2-thiomethyl-A-37 hydroxylase MiaE